MKRGPGPSLSSALSQIEPGRRPRSRSHCGHRNYVGYGTPEDLGHRADGLRSHAYALTDITVSIPHSVAQIGKDGRSSLSRTYSAVRFVRLAGRLGVSVSRVVPVSSVRIRSSSRSAR
jgi:hypothetical protein